MNYVLEVIGYAKIAEKTMKLKDIITYAEIAIEKYEGQESFEQIVDDMKENVRRLKLLPPYRLEKEISKAKADQVRKLYKKLKIEITPITQDSDLIVC